MLCSDPLLFSVLLWNMAALDIFPVAQTLCAPPGPHFCESLACITVSFAASVKSSSSPELHIYLSRRRKKLNVVKRSAEGHVKMKREGEKSIQCPTNLRERSEDEDNREPKNSASNETECDGLLTTRKPGDERRLWIFKVMKHNLKAYESLREQGKVTDKAICRDAINLSNVNQINFSSPSNEQASTKHVSCLFSITVFAQTKCTLRFAPLTTTPALQCQIGFI